MVSAMISLKRAGVGVGVLVIAGVAFLLWYVYGAWPVPDGYEFPRHSHWGGGPTALFTGELVDEDGCIRTSGEGRATVIWPPGYSLRLDNNRRPEVSGGGRVIAMGMQVRLGGGTYDTRTQLAGISTQGAADTRCPPPFFLTTGLAE